MNGVEDHSTAAAGAAAPKERLSSLDVFRGFTVALMVFVDDVGSAFPPIDHSPWDGIR
jgi:predicted acyltransferase